MKLAEHGSRDQRINMLILSEGYTEAELPKFRADALALTRRIFAEPPFSFYSNYFNVFALEVASAESGSDHPSQGIFRDTYFNSSYDINGSHVITIPPHRTDVSYATGQGKVDALAMQFLPETHLKLMLVNDPAFGGFAASTAIASTHEQGSEIMLHELGHLFAGLGEEYSGSGVLAAETPNTTTETRPDWIKWRAWIDPTTPIPTPNAANDARVGLFEGAAYNQFGWYRPKFDCKMRTLGVPFCEVCSEAIINAVYWRVRPFESVSPPGNRVQLTGNTATIFQVAPQRPSGHALAIEWIVNGQLITRDTSLELSANFFGPGIHEVRMRIEDPTDRLRIDRTMLIDGHSWQVEVSNTAQPALLLVRAGKQLEIRWSAAWTGFHLEEGTLNGST
ncbi:MAG: M64 family metallopeptidase, partial [Verrucomicrobiota bacterium]